MAPGLDGLPAAERDLDVSGPVAEFLRSLSPRVLFRLQLGLRAFEWLPFPWRFSRLDPAAADEFLARLERSRFPLHHELLLMAKIFSTLGYAVAPEVEARIGTEISCALADGSLPEPAGSLGDIAPPRRGRGMRCRDRRLGRRRRRRRGDPGRGGARRPRARGRRPLRPRQLPSRPPRGDHDALPRSRPDDRRRPPADPGPGRESGRRHHRDQLRHLLPGAPTRSSRAGARSSDSPGRASSTPTTSRRRSSCG